VILSFGREVAVAPLECHRLVAYDRGGEEGYIHAQS